MLYSLIASVLLSPYFSYLFVLYFAFSRKNRSRRYHRIVIVTGAACGIGKGVAIEYAKYGAHLIILDVLEDKLSATVAEMKEAGYVIHNFVCDLTNDEVVALLSAQNNQGYRSS